MRRYHTVRSFIRDAKPAAYAHSSLELLDANVAASDVQFAADIWEASLTQRKIGAATLARVGR